MAVFLLVMAIIAGYSFVGALTFTKYQAVTSRNCRNGGPEFHWHNCHKYNEWCGHTSTALWLMGIAWPIGIPASVGVLMGKSDSVDRTERRREREIEEAKHKVRLAEIRAEETEALERALEKN